MHLAPVFHPTPDVWLAQDTQRRHFPITNHLYRLAKKLAGTLSPLAGRTKLYMKNSSVFAQRVRKINTQKGEMMVGFDVVNPFTEVPVDDALQVIFTLLTQDKTLNERTTIPVPDTCSLTKLCLPLCSKIHSLIRPKKPLWDRRYCQ